MAWKVEFTADAAKQLEKSGKDNARRILSFLRERVTLDPRQNGSALRGTQREFWRYRVGDFRVLVHIKDTTMVVLVVKVGHRRDVYR